MFIFNMSIFYLPKFIDNLMCKFQKKTNKGI